MKKAIVRTKIYEFLDNKEKEGHKVDPDFVLQNLQDMWKFIQEQPDDLLENATYDTFYKAAIHGFQTAAFDQQFSYQFNRG
jgi:hypothetical protein